MRKQRPRPNLKDLYSCIPAYSRDEGVRKYAADCLGQLGPE
ncbi:hypothetical protein AK812_SmicGene47835, partial [Symbiodinium microadriaticum]